MELWDVYNGERTKTGRVIKRGEPMEKGGYHLVVHVCVFNTEGEMLIQQRQPFKSGWPDKWDITVGGSAVSGEDSCAAAEREVYEEIGLRLDLKGIRPKLTVNYSIDEYDGFDDIYLIEKDIDITSLRLQYEEVKQVKWAAQEEIFRLIDNGSFIPYYKSMIQFFFESRGSYGCHKLS